MKPSLVAFALLCVALTGMAQEEFVPPQAKLITRFPFTQLSGGIVIVRAQIDNFPIRLTWYLIQAAAGSLSIQQPPVTSRSFCKNRKNDPWYCGHQDG
jgi:hypothetical protein